MKTIFIGLKIILFIFQWFKQKGQIEDARKAVEATLLVISKNLRSIAKRARSSVDHDSPDGVLNDQDNRDRTINRKSRKSSN